MTSLADLEAMGRRALANLWTDVFRTDVQANMSQPMQRRFLAFERQARAEGGLAASLPRAHEQIAAGEERKALPTVNPGARLQLAWNGVTHVVDVLPDGYLWNGTRQSSLSAIARAITGARWSGPRFFGLTGSGDVGNGSAARKVAKGRDCHKERAA